MIKHSKKSHTNDLDLLFFFTLTQALSSHQHIRNHGFQTQGCFYLQLKRHDHLILSLAKCDGTEVCFIGVSCHVLLHDLGSALQTLTLARAQRHIHKPTYLDKVCALSMVNREQLSSIQLVQMLVYLDKADKVKVNGVTAARSL